MLTIAIHSKHPTDIKYFSEPAGGRWYLWEGLSKALTRFLTEQPAGNRQQTGYTYFKLQAPQNPERSWSNECIAYLVRVLFMVSF